MPFEDTVRTVERLRTHLSRTQEFLEQARSAIEELNNDIIDAQQRLRFKKEDNSYANNLASKILQDLKNSGALGDLLIGAIDSAILVNDEFSRSPYRQALYNVARDSDTYLVTVRQSGWASSLFINILFEEVAGNLTDWARGVELYREDLNTKINEDEQAGRAATDWWFSNVFRTGLEAKTILSRIGYSGKPAAFWQLLNNGSQALESDRPDGSYNPVVSAPTDFVGEAEQRIRDLFVSLLTPERLRWESEIRELESEIREAIEIRDDFDRDIQGLSSDPSRDAPFLERIFRTTTVAKETDPEEDARRLRAGSEYSTPRPEDGRQGFSEKVKSAAKKAVGFVRGLFK